jgi:FkbH-like protein
VRPKNVQKATIDRDSVTEHLQAGRFWPAVQCARQLLAEEPGARTNRFLRKAVDAAEYRLPLRPFKVALLSSYSIEFVHDALIAHGFASGFRVEIYQPAFGAFRQELLDPRSGLYAANADAVILAVERDAWLSRADAAGTAPEDVAGKLTDQLRALVGAFRARSSAALLVHNFALPAWPEGGIADPAASESNLVAMLNQRLHGCAREERNLHVVDYAALVNRFGALRWYDDRMRLYARAPIAQEMLGVLAAEYVRFFRALAGLSKKCLVLDLDNTLWGGVIGEDGLSGIRLGPDYPGSAFVEFQRQILALRDRGVILAIASKNNPSDVNEVFARHSFMLLKPEHFSAMQIGWQPKSESIRNIAGHLNIGVDQLVFADDSAFECEHVREVLPMVPVIQLPPEPERYVGVLMRDGWFDGLTISDEDRRRGDLYRQRDEAESLRSASGTVEDFYRELEMTLQIEPVTEASLARAAQLTQKTNQFNTTTRRYADAEVARRVADPEWIVRTVRVRDRFGDNGIVGLMMAQVNGTTLEIDTFLLSCRVIGRTVETAMLAFLCDEARQRDLERLTGTVVPTEKNVPVRDLFERHGFDRAAAGEGEATQWTRNIRSGAVAWPDWFRIGSADSMETVTEGN